MLHRIGEMLREAREAKGLSLAEIQMETNIRRTFLEALEGGADHDAFPGVPYHRGFLKSYARAIGVPQDTVLHLYDQYYAPPPQKTEGSGKDAVGKSHRPAALVAPASSEAEPGAAATQEVVAAAPTTTTRASVPVRRQTRPMLPKAPRRSPEPSHPRGAAARSLGKRSVVVLGVIALVVVMGVSAWYLLNRPALPATGLDGTKPGTQPGIQPGTEPVTQPPAPPTPPAVTVTQREVDAGTLAFDVKGADKVTVVVKVNDACWFGVTQDGKLIAEETLRPGDTRTWSANGNLQLRVGNPGGATMTVNGQEKGPIGAVGMPKTIIIQKAP